MKVKIVAAPSGAGLVVLVLVPGETENLGPLAPGARIITIPDPPVPPEAGELPHPPPPPPVLTEAGVPSVAAFEPAPPPPGPPVMIYLSI